MRTVLQRNPWTELCPLSPVLPLLFFVCCVSDRCNLLSLCVALCLCPGFAQESGRTRMPPQRATTEGIQGQVESLARLLDFYIFWDLTLICEWKAQSGISAAFSSCGSVCFQLVTDGPRESPCDSGIVGQYDLGNQYEHATKSSVRFFDMFMLFILELCKLYYSMNWL